MTTLVIGARGSVGRQVLDQLLALGEPVRASARTPETADLPAGVPVVAADLTRPQTLPAALDGVRKVFVYATAGLADFAVAARAAGVEHVVVLSSGSVLLPYAHGNAIAEEHRAMERVLAASGLRWTPIRPLVLANNALAWSYSIRAEGVARMLHPEAATAPIHERDVAAAAVAALTGRAESGVSDLLTGGELMSQRRQVELIGEAAGRPVRIEELTEARAQREFERFGSPAAAASIVQFIVAAARGGSPATGTARRILGRPPLPFARWAADHAAMFA
ncbi:NAD(P)H-binding protein [Streptomyces melanogenes]|uniref:NAD(P)H-binding protein n=1 Tax=Streptomyces melanogenes TaxID=67326 RepID=UPI00167EEFE8|nr:NAD(P)H-binding protein [Streptomyces melanogenes]GGP46094.1 nucleotide-diphosphate-sugar epimerase [Streptomyces melanogenes]